MHLEGPEVPKFLHDPIGYTTQKIPDLNPNLDLSQFSDRVRGLTWMVHKVQPYLKPTETYRWTDIDPGFVSKVEQGEVHFSLDEIEKMIDQADESGFVLQGDQWYQITPDAQHFIDKSHDLLNQQDLAPHERGRYVLDHLY